MDPASGSRIMTRLKVPALEICPGTDEESGYRVKSLIARRIAAANSASGIEQWVEGMALREMMKSACVARV